jgi:hypothetical protein
MTGKTTRRLTGQQRRARHFARLISTHRTEELGHEKKVRSAASNAAIIPNSMMPLCTCSPSRMARKAVAGPYTAENGPEATGSKNAATTETKTIRALRLKKDFDFTLLVCREQQFRSSQTGRTGVRSEVQTPRRKEV